jgi:hypothetical protein
MCIKKVEEDREKEIEAQKKCVQKKKLKLTHVEPIMHT